MGELYDAVVGPFLPLIGLVLLAAIVFASWAVFIVVVTSPLVLLDAIISWFKKRRADGKRSPGV